MSKLNDQNINNSECLGIQFVKIYSEMTTQYFFLNMVLVNYIGMC